MNDNLEKYGALSGKEKMDEIGNICKTIERYLFMASVEIENGKLSYEQLEDDYVVVKYLLSLIKYWLEHIPAQYQMKGKISYQDYLLNKYGISIPDSYSLLDGLKTMEKFKDENIEKW